MQTRVFSLVLCLWAPFFLHANVIPKPFSITSGQEIGSCKIPPPTNFHVTEQGPTSVIFAWTPYYDGAEHRIKTYRASDNLLLNTTVVPAGLMEATIEPLPDGTELYSTINTICSDGSDGPISDEVDSRTVILDLIVAGYQPGNSPSCTIQTANTICYFWANGTTTTFKIYDGTVERKFGVLYNPTTQHLEVCLGSTGNTGQNLKLYCDASAYQGINPPCYNTEKIYVKYRPSGAPEYTVAEFDLREGSSTGVGILRCFALVSWFKIERLGPGPTGGRPADPINWSIRERGDFYTAYGQLATASPNPFTETLDVFPTNPITEKITVQLYNLSGQKVLDQKFSGGQEQYSLPTAALSPGFYLLRVEADGEVQILKVIKSE